MVITVETEGSWHFFAPNNKTHLYDEKMNMSAAELFCVDQGGHLASVGSQEEQDELKKVSEGWIEDDQALKLSNICVPFLQATLCTHS